EGGSGGKEGTLPGRRTRTSQGVALLGSAARRRSPVMPKDHDFKRLVRARMDDTGERYTQARAALAAQRGAPGPPVSDRTRGVLGHLAAIALPDPTRPSLERLPEPERRAPGSQGGRPPARRGGAPPRPPAPRRGSAA